MKMQNFQSILAAVDRGGQAEMVGRKAAALARLTGANLELFLCDAARAYAQQRQYDPASAVISREACVTDGRQFLDRLWRTLGIRDVAATTEAACESPLYEGIVHEVKRRTPDLVVRGVGAGIEGKSADHGLDATDWNLVRTCPAPLLLTRGREWRSHPVIAAAIDLSSEESTGLTQAILHAAGDLARRSKGRLEILHAGQFASTNAGESGSAELASRRMALERLADDADIEIAAIHLIHGDPATVLPPFAAGHDFDLIALGALTHRKSLTALVGTLTGQLIEVLDSDILLVKAPRSSRTTRGTARRSRGKNRSVVDTPAPPY